jgi:1-phosphatidylinositol-4-phosphate 5-kinase
MHELDRYIFIIFCPLALISSSFVIYTFIKYPECRRTPGDIMLVITFSEVVLNIHWIIMGNYLIYLEKEKKRKEKFSQK